jgi:DNA-binding NarL/FixJ family response regulator
MAVGATLVSRESQESERQRNVILVAHRQLVRDAVGAALATHGFVATSMPVARSTAEIQDMRRRLAHRESECALLVGEVDDVAGLRELSAVIAGVDLRWVVLTGTPPGPAWQALRRAGARLVLSESIRLDTLCDLLREVAEGRPAPPDDPESSDGGTPVAGQRTRLTGGLQRLSAREMDVLVLLAQGASVKEIAFSTGVAESTVRTQVKAILRKLGVPSQLKAVATFRSVNQWLADLG